MAIGHVRIPENPQHRRKMMLELLDLDEHCVLSDAELLDLCIKNGWLYVKE